MEMERLYIFNPNEGTENIREGKAIIPEIQVGCEVRMEGWVRGKSVHT